MDLSDGSSFLLFDEDARRVPGDAQVDEQVLEVLNRSSRLVEAFRKGLELCARREHSTLQLRNKLLVRGFPSEAVEEAVARLTALRALDDRRYCRVWTMGQLRRKRYNGFQLRGKLLAAGVGSGIVDEVLLSLHGRDEELASLSAAIKKLKRKAGISDEKIIASLLRKGYQYRDIKGEIHKENRR